MAAGQANASIDGHSHGCSAAAFGVRDEEFAMLQIFSGNDPCTTAWQPCRLRTENGER